ncbi:polyphenol oxidase family protein [Cellulomonas sp. KRMCY2]|uniref:polyphenol oxidase family protein n=1 Tax=Cellulomonas sp. KRMCY2 TaxID=1304865 RepID=UPI00045EC137|nr:polyphenol oxidase family protein [Cellulomonas sp. KRMCY2]
MTSAAPALLEVDLGQGVRAAFTTATPDPAQPDPAQPDGAAQNLSLVLGDDEHRVLARRARLEAWVGAPIAYPHQVHGAQVHVCRSPPTSQEPVAVADALVTTLDTLALAVLVADCVPVLLADERAGVVAAVHAGRRGVVAGAVPAAVAVMVAHGARVGHIRAAVGPAVCGRCYEVPADLRREVDAAVPGSASTTSWGTPALDLPVAVTRQLMSCGIGQIVAVGGCTLTDERWFSHRGSSVDGSRRPHGRFAGVVRLLPRS